MGIEFREGSLSITPTCHAKATKGMIFNVNIGLSGLVNKEASDSKGKDVSLFIGDSVLVCHFKCSTVERNLIWWFILLKKLV